MSDINWTVAVVAAVALLFAFRGLVTAIASRNYRK